MFCIVIVYRKASKEVSSREGSEEKELERESQTLNGYIQGILFTGTMERSVLDSEGKQPSAGMISQTHLDSIGFRFHNLFIFLSSC